MNYFELEAIDFRSQLEGDNQSLLIDVREDYEHEDDNIGGLNIPMGSVLSRINDLKNDATIYLYCKSGKRSKAVAHHLASHVAPSKIYTLIGGIEAYKQQINE